MAYSSHYWKILFQISRTSFQIFQIIYQEGNCGGICWSLLENIIPNIPNIISNIPNNIPRGELWWRMLVIIGKSEDIFTPETGTVMPPTQLYKHLKNLTKSKNQVLIFLTQRDPGGTKKIVY